MFQITEEFPIPLLDVESILEDKNAIRVWSPLLEESIEWIQEENQPLAIGQGNTSRRLVCLLMDCTNVVSQSGKPLGPFSHQRLTIQTLAYDPRKRNRAIWKVRE